jgi:hypothetical protein
MEVQRLRVSLFHSLGKFTTYLHGKSSDMQDMILYLIHEEFSMMPDTKDVNVEGNPSIYILKAILGILDHNVCFVWFNLKFCKTDLTSAYVGCLFKKYIHPLMKSNIPDLQALAVQFVR